MANSFREQFKKIKVVELDSCHSILSIKFQIVRGNLPELALVIFDLLRCTPFVYSRVTDRCSKI